MIAPQSTAHFEKYVSLANPKTGKAEKFTNTGVILTEKLATDMNAKKGHRVVRKAWQQAAKSSSCRDHQELCRSLYVFDAKVF